MGAGNYFFSAPAGDEWSKMIYVDLLPVCWGDEVERRKAEFEQYLQTTADDTEAPIGGVGVEKRERQIEECRTQWMEDHYPGPSNETEFAEDQIERQKEDVLEALHEGFPGASFELDGRLADTVADATVVGEVGRMLIVSAYTYYGSDLALIVTPKSELQDVIWSIENGGFEFERRWPSWQRNALLAENARLGGIKRSVESGALHREMQSTFLRLLRALQASGLEMSMWFRNGAWMGTSYAHRAIRKEVERMRPSRSQRFGPGLTSGSTVHRI